MKAQDIISKARKELVDFIIFEMKMIFMYIYKGEEPCAGCDWVIEAGDLVTNPSVGVIVTDCEGNDCTEYRQVQEIHVDENRKLTIITGCLNDELYTDAEPKELNVELIGTDELSYIADALEKTWDMLIGKK